MIRSTIRTAWAMPGARAGTIVLAASLVGHLGNYLYYVVAGHMLGTERFADVSVMIALAAIIYTPFSGLQASVARDVARLRADGDMAGLSGYVRLLGRRVGPVLVGLTVALAAVVPLITSWLRLETPWLAALAVVWVMLWVVLLIGAAIAQGLERFGTVAFQFAGPQGLLRPLLLPLGVLAVGISGSMLAMIVATLVGLVVLLPPVRYALSATPRPVTSIKVAGPVMALVSFAVVTNADQLTAKVVLSDAGAGLYSAAALLGKIALFAPAALAFVLLPRVSAARARGEDPSTQVLVTMGVTTLTGLGITGVLALMPPGFLALTFGAGFVEARPLLGPLALVMTGAAMLNVHISAGLASMERWVGPTMAFLAVACLGLLAVLHDSPFQIVGAIAIAIGLGLVLAEWLSDSGIVRSVIRLARKRAAR